MIDSILAGDDIIPVSQIIRVDISRLLTDEDVTVHTGDRSYVATGFHAIETVMAVKPSAFEGRRLKWRKGAWAFHNTFGHVGLQILVWLGYPKLGLKWHDYTSPGLNKFVKTKP